MHEGQVARIEKIITHEMYNIFNEYEQFDDIALIKTSEPMKLGVNHVNSVCLPPKNTEQKGVGMLPGWGSLDDPGVWPQKLQALPLPLIDNSICKYFYQILFDQDFEIPEQIMCAGEHPQRMACEVWF